MGSQRPQHPEHLLEVAALEHLGRLHQLPLRHQHRQHHVAHGLAGGGAHHPAHGLDYVDVGPLGGQERHRVQRRDVHPLGETAGVGQHPGPRPVGRLRRWFGVGGSQPAELGRALVGVHLAVDVVGVEAQGGGAYPPPAGAVCRGPAGERGESRRRLGGGLHGVGEGDGPPAVAHPGRDLAHFAVLAAGAEGGGIGQRVPAAEQLHHVFVVHRLGLAGRGGHLHAVAGAGAQQVAVGLLAHADNQHLVVRQQALLDGLTEGHRVQQRPELLLVLHREHIVVAVGLGLRLGRLGVDPLSGGHVQPPPGQQVVLVVYPLEQGRFVVGSGSAVDSGGAVGLVADHQVEGRATVGVLGQGHLVQRLVGAEHGGHGLRGLHLQLRGDLGGVGGDRHGQLRHRHVGVVGPAPDLDVGAHPQIAVRHRPLPRPLPHGLIHERDGRHQVQHPPGLAAQPLGGPQRHHRLAGAARHQQSAPVGGGQPVGHRVHRRPLVGPGGVSDVVVLRPVGVGGQVEPVEGPGVELGSVEDLGVAGAVELLCGGAGVVGGGHEDPRRPFLAVGGGQELVHVGGADPAGVVELALDGAQPAAVCLGLSAHQVDADVAGVEAVVAAGPIAPQPQVLEPGRPVLAGVIPQGGQDHPLEQPARPDGRGGRPGLSRPIPQHVESGTEMRHVTPYIAPQPTGLRDRDMVDAGGAVRHFRRASPFGEFPIVTPGIGFRLLWLHSRESASTAIPRRQSIARRPSPRPEPRLKP